MGDGVNAYLIEYKTTTTRLLSSSSSLDSLRRVRATSLTATRSRSPVESFVALGPWVRVPLSSMALVTLSFVGAGHSTAIAGGLCGCWVVDVVCWVLAMVCHSLSSVLVVVDWAARFVCGGGCVTWQRAMWRAHALSLTLVTGACGCRVSLSGSCRGWWAAKDVRGGGCYEWAMWRQALLRWWLWDEEGRRVTVCDMCDFRINVPTRDRAWITLAPKFVVYTVL